MQAPKRASTLVSRLTRRVRAELEEAGLCGKRLVVAVSGGPDSLALLHLLARLQRSCRLDLHVGHVDHGLRADSAEDARFVARESERLGVPFTGRRVDVQAHRRRRRLSPEHAARELRYAFLGELCRETGAAAVALGHTADDQAETILLHILRGSGLRGLQGMVTLSQYGGKVSLFRPLLAFTREESEGFCRALGLAPRHDVSNLDVAYTRNLIRNQIVPLLQQVNPKVRDALLRLGRAAALDDAYLEAQAATLWPSVAAENATGVELERKALLAQHPAVRRALLRRAYAHVHGDLQGLEEVHVDAMERVLAGATGRVLDLPNGVRWAVGYKTATLRKREDLQRAPFPALEGVSQLACPGETAVAGWTVTTRFVEPMAVNEGPYVAVVDGDAAGLRLAVQARKEGDCFWPLGVENASRKRLKDFFVDAKVPRAWRARVPLVVGEQGVVWVVGWRIAHWARLTPKSRRGLRVEFRQSGEEHGSRRNVSSSEG
ncbi:MAG: tRNA lysidine(34) synthetase TilS [Dehalococcoidia bacterium]|nr:tRNA lysidine(34) synthetase TilS [Dehalococcoidia bacterium]